MLWFIVAVLLLLWVIGWGFGVAGAYIHVLLIVAAIVVVIQFGMGRRRV